MNFIYNHLHFRSEDPDAAAKFYCDNFGAEITGERPLSTTKSITLALNGQPLMTISGRAEGEDPVPGSTEPRYGLDHFGFEVDDREETASIAMANGATQGPQETPQDGRFAETFIRDPSGTRVDLSQAGWLTEAVG